MNAIRHVILGLFFFITLAVLGFVTIYLGDFTSSDQTTRLVAYFDEVDELGAGDQVLLYGVPSGRVTSVEFNEPGSPPEKRVLVAFNVTRPIKLKKDYDIRIGSPGLLGGRRLEVISGDGEPLAPTEYANLHGAADANLVRQLTGLLGENRADVHRIVHGLGNVVSDLDQGKRTLLDVMLRAQAHDDLNAAIASGRGVFEKANGVEGSIGRALASPVLHDTFVGFAQTGQSLLADAKDKPGVIHTLVYDEGLATQLKGGVASLSETAERVGEIVTEVRAGKGLMGKLFSDAETEQRVANVIMKFSGVADDLGAIVDGARRGRGIAGYLLADDQARRTLEHVVDSIARAIDDAREAAPVSSVFSFLFGSL